MTRSTTDLPAWPLAIFVGAAGALCALAAGLSAPRWARRLVARGLTAWDDNLADLGGDD